MKKDRVFKLVGFDEEVFKELRRRCSEPKITPNSFLRNLFGMPLLKRGRPRKRREKVTV